MAKDDNRSDWTRIVSTRNKKLSATCPGTRVGTCLKNIHEYFKIRGYPWISINILKIFKIKIK